MTNPFHPFTPPFKFDDEAYIWDSSGNIVFQVRGWGRLIHEPISKLAAIDRQNEIGRLVAQLMNEHSLKEGM